MHLFEFAALYFPVISAGFVIVITIAWLFIYSMISSKNVATLAYLLWASLAIGLPIGILVMCKTETLGAPRSVDGSKAFLFNILFLGILLPVGFSYAAFAAWQPERWRGISQKIREWNKRT